MYSSLPASEMDANSMRAHLIRRNEMSMDLNFPLTREIQRQLASQKPSVEHSSL